MAGGWQVGDRWRQDHTPTISIFIIDWLLAKVRNCFPQTIENLSIYCDRRYSLDFGSLCLHSSPCIASICRFHRQPWWRVACGAAHRANLSL